MTCDHSDYFCHLINRVSLQEWAQMRLTEALEASTALMLVYYYDRNARFGVSADHLL